MFDGSRLVVEVAFSLTAIAASATSAPAPIPRQLGRLPCALGLAAFLRERFGILPSIVSAADPMKDRLLVDAVSHAYGPVRAVDAVTLDIGAGELVALLGPSGCGKTTLLRIVAGFVRQTSGSVVIGEQRADDLPPNRRQVGIVFQSYALFPHMTAAENVAYGLAARGIGRAEREQRVADMLELVRMVPYADRYRRACATCQRDLRRQARRAERARRSGTHA